MFRKNFPGRSINRREEAAQRQVQRDKLSDVAQLSILDSRLGKDEGAKRERLRLTKRITKVN